MDKLHIIHDLALQFANTKLQNALLNNSIPKTGFAPDTIEELEYFIDEYNYAIDYYDNCADIESLK